MSQSSRTLFISDLHLDQDSPDITRLFLQFLSDLKPSDTLYILGDLFETWIGDDHDIPYHHDIIAALKTATQTGIPIYFLHGNRDFLISKRFIEATGCQLLPDETKLNLYGKSVLIMHGDTLCTSDIAYIRARKIMRNPFLKTIFLSLPINIRLRIAHHLRQKSMQHTATTAYEIMDVTEKEVSRIMQKHAVTTLIHGHTHRLGTHTFTRDETCSTRIVLGAWHEQGSVLIWNASGERELITFP